jgi:hypothetical protein
VNNQTYLDFSRRTDALASKLGIRLGDMPAKLRISRASFFSYRAGKNTISKKAWHKLELTERESGISPPLHEQLASAPANRKKALLGSAPLEEVVNLLPPDARKRIATTILDAQIDSIQINLIGFFLDAQALADLVKRKGSKSELNFFAQKVGESVKSSREMLELLVLQLRTALDLDIRTLAERMEGAGAPDKLKVIKASSASDREKPRKKKR